MSYADDADEEETLDFDAKTDVNSGSDGDDYAEETPKTKPKRVSKGETTAPKKKKVATEAVKKASEKKERDVKKVKAVAPATVAAAAPVETRIERATRLLAYVASIVEFIASVYI